MRRAWRGRAAAALAASATLALTGCGNTRILSHSATTRQPTVSTAAVPAPGTGPAARGRIRTVPSRTSTPSQLGFPYLATKNTTRVAGSDPISDAAAVALSVFPSTAAGTHPTAVVLAPTDDWQAALAASSLMGSPFRAPILLSGPGGLPTASAAALKLLAPVGDASLGDVQLVRVGHVPAVKGLTSTHISGANPYGLAADIDRYEATRRNRESTDVVIASADAPADAMPAAGWAAESGEPVLFVSRHGIPAATARQLAAHRHSKLYVLGPSTVIPDSVLSELRRYGTVKRIPGRTAAQESVNFAAYRDPACPTNGQGCAHIPHSFGWAIRSPGHGYVLMNEDQPLDAAAAAALSASGSYGPQLLVSAGNTLPKAVLNYFLDYATPGYTSEGPTAAVYNHAWLIGNTSEISESVQAQVDSILEVVPAK